MADTLRFVPGAGGADNPEKLRGLLEQTPRRKGDWAMRRTANRFLPRQEKKYGKDYVERIDMTGVLANPIGVNPKRDAWLRSLWRNKEESLPEDSERCGRCA